MQEYPQSVEHLLKRKPISTDTARTRAAIEGKIVLVTGAGGSIGTALCRRIVEYNPKRLVLLDSSEHALYQIDYDLGSGRGAGSEARNAFQHDGFKQDGFKLDGQLRKTAADDLAPVLGDVCDSKFLDRVLD